MVLEAVKLNENNVKQMEYLFLRRKKTTAISERQRTLLFKAAERQWKEEFAGKEADARKVDCHI